jgi:glycosyltransferase involved in cell wall biosynthesis
MNFHLPYIEAFVKSGHEVFVVTEMDPEKYAGVLDENAAIHWISVKTSKSPLSLTHYHWYKAFKALTMDTPFDRIVFNTPIPSFLGRMAGRSLKNTQLIYIAHGFHFYKGAPLKNWLLYYVAEKIAAHWTDLLFLMNEEDTILAGQRLVNKRLTKENIRFISGIGVDLDDFNTPDTQKKDSALLEVPEGLKKIICVAELTHRKNQIQLIDAMGQVDQGVLFLVGDGPLADEYHQYVKANKLTHRVRFLGFRRDIPQILDEAHLAVMTSRHEGLPRFLMEAMAKGLPVVCSDVRGNRDLIKAGINGLLVPLDDSKSTAKAILEILNSPEIQHQFSHNNKRDILPYGIDQVLPDFMDALGLKDATIKRKPPR